MQATVYANLTNRRLTSTLGGSAISFPAFVQGDKVRIGLRFAESLEGSPIEVQKTATHIRASIGFVDARPTSGSFVLTVDGQETAPISHDATAGTLQAALAAVGLDDTVVSKQDGSWIISTGAEDIEITGASAEGLLSELRPVSFVRVRSTQIAGQFRHEVRLVQAPLASTAIVRMQPVSVRHGASQAFRLSVSGTRRRAAVFALLPAISMWPRSHLMSSQSRRRISADRMPANPPMAISGRIRALAARRILRISSGVKISIFVSGSLNDSLNSAAVLRSGWR